MDYFYDNEGKPYKLQVSEGNGTYTGYYVLNQQGDVIAILNANGVKVVSYEYNAWGQIKEETASVTNSGSLFLQHNALKYRGYYYDADLGLYYLGSRFYDQNICRFVNADTTDVLMADPSSLTDKNLYSYCDNNPVMRKDESGAFWVTLGKMALGVISTYAGDVIENIKAGATGKDIFKTKSTMGEYIAAGITAVIPGSGFGASFIRQGVTEGILCLERAIKGKKNSLVKSLAKVTAASVLDTAFEQAANKVTSYVSSKTPRNYSSYAGTQYKKHPNITQPQIRKKLKIIGKVESTINNCINFIFNRIKGKFPI